jgi:hypothetical protein
LLAGILDAAARIKKREDQHNTLHSSLSWAIPVVYVLIG